MLAAADRLNAKISTIIGEFDHAKLWDLDAATSMKAWLKQHGNLTERDATRYAATARRLRTCTIARHAWTTGTISGGQVAAVVTNVKDRTAHLFAAAEHDIITTITGLSVADTTTVMQRWAAKAEAIADEDNPPEPPANSLHHSHTLDGRSELAGSFDAESAAVIDRALDEAMPTFHADDRMTASERRAQSLLDIMRSFLDHHTQPTGRRNRPHVSFIITDEDFHTGGPGHTTDGAVVDQNGAILDYGRATRTISPDLFAALSIRDGGCRWPGCERPPKYTEAHHIEHWDHGGTTEPANLVLLCSRHHHRLHQSPWTLNLLDDNTVEITRPGHAPDHSRAPLRC